jgi:hypothetical protein
MGGALLYTYGVTYMALIDLIINFWLSLDDLFHISEAELEGTWSVISEYCYKSEI